MPQPENINAGYSPFLTDLAISYIPTFEDYIAGLVCPRIPVGSQIGQYNIWLQNDFLRRGGKRLSNYEAAPIEGFKTSKGSFTTYQWGVASNWTQQDLQTAAVTGITPEQLERTKTQFVVGKAIMEREVDVAALYQTAGNWSTTYAGVSSGPTGLQFVQWDQLAATPVDDVEVVKQAFRLLSGQKINTMILPQLAWSRMKKNTSLIDRIKYGGTMDRPTQVTLTQLKQLFEIDNIYLAGSVYNSAAEGATPTYTDIWGKTAWMGYIAPSPGLETPSAAYNFVWSGGTTNGMIGAGGPGPQAFDAQQNDQGFFIRRYRENRPSAEFVECEKYENPVVTAPALGVTFTAAIA